MYIQDNESTAARRRVSLYVYADATTAWAGSVTGVKAQLSVNGASEVASTNDIVRVAGVLHYVELTQAEVDRAPGDLLHVRLPAAAGRLEAFNVVEIGADSPAQAAATPASVSTQVLGDLASTPGAAARTAIAGAVDTAVADNFAAVPGAVDAAVADNFTAVLNAIASVTTATEAALADNISAVPAAVVTAMRTEETLSAWGVTSQPAGGSTLTYAERRNGTVIGSRTAYFNAANVCVGMTAVA